MISGQWTPLLLRHRSHWNQWQEMHFWWKSFWAQLWLSCRNFGKVLDAEGVIKLLFKKRFEEWLFWHALTPHYSFRTGRTSDGHKRIQYTWPGCGRGKWALLQKRVIAYTQIKLLDINDLRYLTLEDNETNSHTAFTVVNNHLCSCLLQCSIYSIHMQLNQL